MKDTFGSYLKLNNNCRNGQKMSIKILTKAIVYEYIGIFLHCSILFIQHQLWKHPKETIFVILNFNSLYFNLN